MLSCGMMPSEQLREFNFAAMSADYAAFFSHSFQAAWSCSQCCLMSPELPHNQLFVQVYFASIYLQWPLVSLPVLHRAADHNPLVGGSNPSGAIIFKARFHNAAARHF
jgi:hypothetical protein